MKLITSFALLGALATFAAQGAVTTPVGYYNFDGQAGGNLFVPGFVNPAAFSGAITGSTATTITVADNSLTAGAFDAGAVYATHYIEFTSGANAGVTVDIASNTASVITLDGDLSALGLVGDETVVVRPHVTLRQALQGGEDFAIFTDSVTFYEPGTGDATTYIYTSSGVWSSDFGTTVDGNDRPVAPGTGFVLGLSAAKSFAVTGEVKTNATVVQLSGSAPNIVGPVNPLVGDSSRLDEVGFQNMTAFTDAVTLYTPGPLSIIDTYLPNGSGQMVDGAFAASDAGVSHTVGGIVTAGGGDTTVTLAPVSVSE